MMGRRGGGGGELGTLIFLVNSLDLHQKTPTYILCEITGY